MAAAGTMLTGVERTARVLQRRPVDRIGVFEHFWEDTQAAWTAAGHLRSGERFEDHFGHDMQVLWPCSQLARVGFVPEAIDEDDDTQTLRDGNWAVLRKHKKHEATPEHISYLVDERAVWEERIKPLLKPERARIDFAAYRDARRRAAAANRFFFCANSNVFEMMHPICGHEYLLMGMAADPDWVRDMADTYSQLLLDCWEILFAEEGAPDGVWFYEDMGFKGRAFFSLDMYREIIQPYHKRTIDWAHARGLPVTMHSCGYVAPILPGMIESGIDALQVIEVKAGMDLLALHRDYGERLTFIGGMDIRTLYGNDRAVIDAELSKKIPVVKQGYGYVLHSDHSIPKTVDYASYRYFVERGLELGAYT